MSGSQSRHCVDLDQITGEGHEIGLQLVDVVDNFDEVLLGDASGHVEIANVGDSEAVQGGIEARH